MNSTLDSWMELAQHFAAEEDKSMSRASGPARRIPGVSIQTPQPLICDGPPAHPPTKPLSAYAGKMCECGKSPAGLCPLSWGENCPSRPRPTKEDEDPNPMALYTRKDGEYVKLTREQVRKLRRTSQVLALQIAAQHLAVQVRAIADWLRLIENRLEAFQTKPGSAVRLYPSDFKVTRLPNVPHIRGLADQVDRINAELRKC